MMTGRKYCAKIILDRLVVAAKGILMLFRSGTTQILFNH
jgi:hypothetical protein